MEFVNECLENWRPRFVVNGVDASDMDRLEGRIGDWAEWCPAWAEFGDRHAGLGEDAEERGDLESAGHHFTMASMYYHFGSHVWHVDDDLRDDVHDRSVEVFQRGGQYLDPQLQRLDAPYDAGGFDVPGNLRVPERGPHGDDGDSPVVILIPGLDSTKEEMAAYDAWFLGRGIATLAMEGGGQGECHQHQGMSPNHHELVSAMIDHLQDLDPEGADTSSLGVMGVSLGGFYAPYAAAHDDRFDACIGISGAFTVGPVSSRKSEMSQEQYQWACKTDDLVEVDDITEAMSLRDCIDDLLCPSLMLTGDQDTIVPPARTERIADEAPNCEYLLYEGGNHVCNNLSYEYKPYVADWFRRQLA